MWSLHERPCYHTGQREQTQHPEMTTARIQTEITQNTIHDPWSYCCWRGADEFMLVTHCQALWIINGQMDCLAQDPDCLKTAHLCHVETAIQCLRSASRWCRLRPSSLHHPLKDSSSSRDCTDSGLVIISVTFWDMWCYKDSDNWHFRDSHEAQLGLPAHQDLPQALDTSHLHLDLIWRHGALCHGHVWVTWEEEGRHTQELLIRRNTKVKGGGRRNKQETVYYPQGHLGFDPVCYAALLTLNSAWNFEMTTHYTQHNSQTPAEQHVEAEVFNHRFILL